MIDEMKKVCLTRKNIKNGDNMVFLSSCDIFKDYFLLRVVNGLSKSPL